MFKLRNLIVTHLHVGVDTGRVLWPSDDAIGFACLIVKVYAFHYKGRDRDNKEQTRVYEIVDSVAMLVPTTANRAFVRSNMAPTIY